MEINASRLLHLVETLERCGADSKTVDDVLKRSGLTRKDVAPTARHFPYKKEVLFVREASAALGDLTFGARAGLSYKVSDSLAGYISKFSRNLRAAVENTARFHELIDPAVQYDLRISGNFAAFEIRWKDASFAKYHRHTEFLMFGVLSRLRTISQTNFYPIEMRFQHEVRQSSGDFEKLSGFPVIFGAETLEIILPLAVLDLPIPTYDLRLREHLTEYGDRLLAVQGKANQTLRSRVEGILTTALPARMLSADEVAASVGMSARTFARRLNDEGTSFRDVVDELRFDLSKTFMKDDMSLSEIAFALGYADQAAFSTAFKRWTGVSPSSFRAQD